MGVVPLVTNHYLCGVVFQMTINFPMPPAIQLLQGLLERAEERHRQRREAGETSSEEEEESEEEESEEETEEEKRKREEKRKELGNGDYLATTLLDPPVFAKIPILLCLFLSLSS